MGRKVHYVMKISSNGQVSIPAEVRAKWETDRVQIINMGNYLIVDPLPEDPIASVMGKYKGLLPSTDEIRRMAREEEVEIEMRDERER